LKRGGNRWPRNQGSPPRLDLRAQAKTRGFNGRKRCSKDGGGSYWHLDVNYRIRNGKRTKEVVIRVHVKEKLPLDQLRPNQRFEFVDGVPVDVVESQNTYQQQSGLTLQGGDGIAPEHQPDRSGTLGILCFTRGSRLKRLLTNAHVVFGGKKKSELPSKIPMIQPGSGDAVIGHGLRDKSFRDALVDCSFIEPSTAHEFLPGIEDLVPQPAQFGKLTKVDVQKKVRVKKRGATTGEREGVVDSVRLTFSTQGHGFLFQIGVKPVDGGPPFSSGGDSGSIVVRGNAIVGLLHGITDSGQTAVACHIDDVLDKFHFEL
jgi:hypothetical protein